MAWQFIAGVILAVISTFLLRPKPPGGTPPPTLGDIRVPTAEDGRSIPVVFGCRIIRGPNVVWYGDARTTPIKVKGGGKK